MRPGRVQLPGSQCKPAGFINFMTKKRKGFTLIELLVVISIIGILSALLMANFNSARERARDVTRKSDLDQMKKALRLYYNDNNSYPEASAIESGWGTGTFANDDGSMVYIKRIPQDPNFDGENNSYNYSPTPDGQDFCLWSTLENKSDKELSVSHTRCATACTSAAGLTLAGQYYAVCAD